MSEERGLYIPAEVDTTRTRAGFNEIAQQGESMAAQVTRSGEQAQRSVSNIGTGAGRSAQSVEAAQRNIIGSIQRTTAAMEAGSRSGAEYYEALARQRGVDPAVLAPYLAQLRAVESQQQRVGMSTREYSAAMRNVPAQITDIVTSLQGGMPPLTVAIQQGGQLRDMFGGIAPAARALSTQLLAMVNPYTVAAAAIAAVGVSYYQGSKEGDAFARSIILTGNAAGVTTGQLTNMAREVSKVSGTQGEAAAALAALAGTGEVGADNLQRFATVAVKAQSAIGVAVEDTVKEFADLAKSPLQATEKLNEQYRYLTGSVYAQIKALQEQGRTDEAAEVAQNAFADALGSRADKMKERLGVIEKAWRGVWAAAKGAGDAMLEVGREETLDQKLAAVQAKIAKAAVPGASGLRTRDARVDLEGNKVLERLLQGQVKLQNEAAIAEGEANKKREARLEWTKQITANMTRQQQLDNELAANELRGSRTGSGATPKEISDQALLIRKKYADVYNDGINSQIEAVKRRGEIEDAVARRSLDLLTANRAAGIVSEEAYTNGVAEFELAAFARRKQQLQQELALTATKQSSQKDQAALSGEIAKQDELATSRRLQLANDLNTLRANGEREVSKQLQESARQREALVASLAVEYQMYGKSADARALAAVSLKSEADLQKKIADAILAKKPLSDDAIARLRAEKDALDEVTRSTMAQTKALDYASQLRDENKRFGADSLADPKARAEALLAIDANVWRERIQLAGDGTQAQQQLQSEFNTWYGNQQRKISTEVDLVRATNLVNIMQAVDDAARQAAQGMAESFGSVGKAIGDLTTSLTGYQSRQATIAAQLAASLQDSKGDPTKIAKAQEQAAQQSAQAQIKSYGDMAGAAKGFFGENSKGYKALQGAEKAYRAFEMAMAIESMTRKLFAVTAVTTATVAGEATKTAAVQAGTAAQVAADSVKGASAAAVGVATQAQGDPYSAWARMAAMAAAMAALGFAVAGGAGGGKSIAEQRQEAQGTGTVFGDSTAKSDSIKRAMELVASNSSIELDYTRGMLTSLRGIESSLAGLGNLLVRTSGLTGDLPVGRAGAAADFFTSTAGTVLLSGVFAPLVMTADKLLGGTLSKWTGSIANAIFGGKKTVEDTGFTIDKTTLAAVFAGGVSSFQYADIKKSGGLFHSDKHTTDRNPLGDEADAQFAKVLANLGAGVTAAAKLLGVGGNEFTARLNSFVVDIGKVSLKGLTGDEIQKQLEAVFSKVGDDMAQFGVAGLAPFQQVGEGYFETLSRIATDYANLDSILASSGTAFGATGMASIAAREHLIELAGGIDKLSSQATSFNDNFLTQAERLAPVQKYVTDQLAAMGLQSLDTRDKFKEYTLDLVNSGALLNTSGDITTRSQAQYLALLALNEAYAKTHAATVDLTKSEQEIADERTDLKNQLDQLTMTQEQLAAKARAAIDAHNLALYDQVVAAQAAKDALTETNTILDLQGQIAAATGDKAAAAAILQKQHEAALVGLTPAVAAATKALWDAQAAEAARVSALAISNGNLANEATYFEAVGDKVGAAAVAQKQWLAALAAMDPALRESATAAHDAQLAHKAAADALSAVSAAYNVVSGVISKQKTTLNDAYTAASDAMQIQIDSATDSIAKFSSLAESLQSTLDAMTIPGQEKNERAAAQAQIAAALAIAKAGGPLPSADSLKAALSTVSKDASSQFATRLDYIRDLYRTKNMVGALDSLADTKLTAEQQMLNTLKEQKKALDDAHKAEIAKLDNQLDQLKTQTDLLTGIAPALMTLPDALKMLAAAIGTATSNPTVGTDALTNLYQTLLGRTPDAGGLAYWKQVLAGGASLSDIAGGIMNDYEYKNLHPFAVGTNYVPGDMPAMIHEGERIIPAADNRQLMARLSRPGGDNTALAAEIRALRAELLEIKAATKSTADSTSLLKRVIRNDRLYASTKEEVSA